MNDNLNIEFGRTGVADTGAALRVQEGPASLRHPMAVTQTGPGLAGDEQLR